jgi:hypothetical protein
VPTRSVTLLCAALLLSACVAGQHIDLRYQPQGQAVSTRLNAVALQVSDQRSYVTNGDKKPWYIGHYRAGFGNTFDVSTRDKLALAEELRADLQKELDGLGYGYLQPGQGKAPRTLEVEIRDWNFDAAINTRVWYELRATVRDAAGKVLAQDQIKKEEVVKGHFLTGAKSSMEKNLPLIYGKVLQELVRDNPKISAALRAPPAAARTKRA